MSAQSAAPALGPYTCRPLKLLRYSAILIFAKNEVNMSELCIIYVVGSPSKLISYTENTLPSGFIHPVPLNKEIDVIRALKYKFKSISKGIQEILHYCKYLNEFFIDLDYVIQNVGELLFDTNQMLKILSTANILNFPFTFVRTLAIESTNRFKIIEFKLQRIIDKVSCFVRRAPNCENFCIPNFPLIT